MTKLTKLFEPAQIGSVQVKNRIVMPPMATRLAGVTGEVTDRLTDYYVERAKGGVGLISVESTCIDSSVGRGFQTQLCVDNDKFVPGLNELAEAVQKHCTKIALELFHSGRVTSLANTGGKQPVSASDVYHRPGNVKARALTIEEIEELVERFADGARRAKSAGFDAVEIQGAHGFLIAQFLSPHINKRTDKYGGNCRNRVRFAVDIVERIKQKVGDNFSIIFRISGDEYIDGGLTLEETRFIAQQLEEHGVDAIDVTAGLPETAWWSIQPTAISPGCLVHLAQGIKKTVKIPVVTVGRINDPLIAEQILREGKADFVAMGRALIADPELPRKAKDGSFDDIRKCLGCNWGCISRYPLLHIRCTVNAAVGRERDSKILQANNPKKVIVVGGGPAGMEAARVARLRGHEVTLYEKGFELGGQLLLSAMPPYKEEFNSLTHYLVHQIHNLGVKVQLGKEVTAQILEEEKPDSVILATGSTPLVPQIPGAKRKHVFTAWDVFKGKAKIGQDIIVAGGGLVGCETAEFLAEKGKKVHIVEMMENVATDVQFAYRKLLLDRLAKHGIEISTNMRIKEITDSGVYAVDKDGKQRSFKAQTIVLAMGCVSNDKLSGELSGKVREIYKIGDCRNPGRIIDAIAEGSHVAFQI